MRDLLLQIILYGLLPFSLIFPFVGASVVAWLSLMNPHRLTFGSAYGMPWTQIFVIPMMIGLLVREPGLILNSISRYKLPLLYLAWMFVTTMFASEFDKSWLRFQEVGKVHVIALASLALVKDRHRATLLLYIVIGSIAFYGIKGGLYTVTGGGGGRVWGPPRTAIEDNNHLAAALVMFLPLLYWAMTNAKKIWIKVAIVGVIGLNVFSIFGSQSRGAFLAIGAITVFLILKGKQKVKMTVIILAVGLTVVPFMPQQYWDRISTISEYEADNSAGGRIHSWTTAVVVASNRITGAGFDYYGGRIYRMYAQNPNKVHSAHSIYFQSLGEHGWIGLTLFLLILIDFWRKAGKISRSRRRRTDANSISDVNLGRLLQVSLIGFCVGGAFVNTGNWDGFYYVYIMVLAFNRVQEAEAVAESAAVQEGTVAGSEIDAESSTLPGMKSGQKNRLKPGRPGPIKLLP